MQTLRKISKKGEVTDIMTIGFWFLVLGIGVLAVMFMTFSLISPLRDTAINEDPNAAAAIDALESYTSYGVPGAFLVVLFGLLFGLVVSSFFIRSNPIFIPVYILFALISIFVAVVLANVWGNITAVAEFAEILEINSVVSLMNIIIRNIVLITLGAFILSLIIVFAKPGQGMQGGGGEPF
jgi:hypothetical protein